MAPLTFYLSEDEFVKISHQLKLMRCPHCQRVGTLNRHSIIYRSGEEKQVRGHRIYCNKRRCRRQGCGHTFRLLSSSYLIGFQLTAISLWRYLSGLLDSETKLEAFRSSDSGLHESAAYRIYRRVQLAQSRIRSLLFLHRAVPDPPDRDSVLRQTVVHLAGVFKKNPCPVASFQHRFQCSFL